MMTLSGAAAAQTVESEAVEIREGDGPGTIRHDDGHGLEVRNGQAKERGLASLEERMRMINGRLELRSQPGQGTTVMFSLPLAG
jgi:nitrate/nitrite-specific signal transduction histidine kinase